MGVEEHSHETLTNSTTSTGTISLTTYPTLTLTDMSWLKLNLLLEPLRQHEPGFPLLTNVQQLIPMPPPDEFVTELQTFRERTHMLQTLF